jgi:glycosyltransferase involved in cell wall biosynthesis
VPTITADAGDDGDLVREFGLGITYDAENPESLRKAILGFAHLVSEDKQEIVGNLSRFAEQHSWQRVAEEHVRVYEACMKGSQGQCQ